MASPAQKIVVLLGILWLSPAAEAAECRMPHAPAAFLDLVSQHRMVSAKVGKPERTKLFNLITKKNDIPNLLSSCRMTPVEVTGEDPFLHQPRKVTAVSYAPKGSVAENLRTIILMPPTGGENALDDAYADHLCRQGFRVVMVQHWERDDAETELFDMDMHDRGAMRAVAAVQDVVEFINPKKPEQLGILGTSVGAITSSLVLGVEARVSTGVLIVGGGGLPEVIGTSTEKHLAELRAARMKKLGFKSEAEYVQALREHVKIDPLDLVSFAQKKNILFFMGLNDKTVATANQKKLYDAFGDQDLVTHTASESCIEKTGSGHFCTILQTSYKEKDRISQYFSAKLSAPTAAEIARGSPAQPEGNKLCLNAKRETLESGDSVADASEDQVRENSAE